MAVAVYNVEDIPTKRALLDLQKQIDELKANALSSSNVVFRGGSSSIAIDSLPTRYSTNAVSSGGVFDELAKKSTVKDTGWIQNGTDGLAQYVKLRRYGNVVSMTCRARNSASGYSNASSNVSIPVGFRPSSDLQGFLCRCYFADGGSTGFGNSIIYPTGTWRVIEVGLICASSPPTVRFNPDKIYAILNFCATWITSEAWPT